MKFTLLFDLDDTLLNTHINEFQKVYLKALGHHLRHRFNPEVLVTTLLKATQKMIENEQPERTLMQTFDDAFYPVLGVSKSDVLEDIAIFYRDVFPTIKSITSQKPEAVDLINNLCAKGHRLVIATNPLFPQTATYQRLAWAGLPVEQYRFALVSTYESFHFAKPNPAYFAEILAQLGWPEDPVIMFGNDPDLDLVPAASMGITTGWLTGDGYTYQDPSSQPTWKGEISGILPWLENNQSSGNHRNLSSTAILAILKSTPAAISTLSQRIPTDKRYSPLGRQEWGLAEITCHLRDLEKEVYLPRLEQTLSLNNPMLKSIDINQWAVDRNYTGEDWIDSFAQFLKHRKETLQILANKTAENWKKPATHEITGVTTLQGLAAKICAHDQEHIRQIYQLIHR